MDSPDPSPTAAAADAAADTPAAVSRESAWLAIDGFELHAERWRGGERWSVLLLHGLGGNSVTWHGVAPLLARAGAAVLAVDLPGFGRTRTHGRALDCSHLSRLVEAVLRAEAAPGTRWVLGGNSLGGVLGLDLAVRVPALVRGVSTTGLALPLTWGRSLREASALFAWVPAAVPWAGRRLFARYMRRTGLPGVVDEPIRALFGDPSRLDAALRERLLDVSGHRASFIDEAGRAYEEVTRSLGLELLLPERLARTIRDAPAAVQSIHGDQDPIFPPATWRVLQRRRPDWEHVLLAGIGHVPQLEAPRAVARHMLRWMQSAAVCHPV